MINKHSIIFRLAFFFGIMMLALSIQNINAQVISEQQAMSELKKLDVDPEELKTKLLEKGIDIEHLENLNASEAINIQSIIEETIAEIKSQKSIESANQKISHTNLTKNPVENKIKNEQNLSDQQIKIKDPKRKIPLPIYGQELFNSQHIKFYQNTSNVKVNTAYILGNGDEISVSIWGLSSLDNVYTINDQGYITPNKMPRIYLRGLSLKKAKQILRNRFASYYRFNSNEFEITLNTSRLIQVNIFGEVLHYGGFTIPATNTAFNAIVGAGGPTALGSVRNIKLIRGKETKILDVYKWMKDPTLAQDYYLQHNDFIQIPKAERVITIEGQIERAMQYELLTNEHLEKLINYAGGLKSSAYLKNIKISRYAGDEQIRIDVPWSKLSSEGKDFKLQHGDIITIDSIAVINENIITVEGAVAYPGEFAWKPDLRLGDLLKLLVFNSDVNKSLAFIQRVNADNTYNFIRVSLNEILQSEDAKDNILLQKKDKLIVLGLQNNSKKATVEIKGAISKPCVHPYDQKGSLRVSDLILLSGGLLKDALQFGYIERNDPNDFGTKIYIRIDVKKAVDNPNSAEDITLSPFDVLIVDSQTRFMESAYFEIMGASRNPGRYNYIKNITLTEALIMAGGLTKSAANQRIDIFRINLQDNKPIKTIISSVSVDRNLNTITGKENIIQPYDQIVVRNMPEFEFQKIVMVKGEVRYPGPYAITIPNEPLSSIVQKAGGLTREAFPEGSTLYRNDDSLGYIVIDLNEALHNNKSRDNIILKKGDQLFIPKQKDLVGIEGATNASDLYYDEMLSSKQRINVPFHNSKNALYYVKKYAAGVSHKGDKKFITVQHPNGHIEYTRNYYLFKIYPKVHKGSIVKVGLKKIKKVKTKSNKREVNWERVQQNFITQATSLLSILAIINTLQD